MTGDKLISKTINFRVDILARFRLINLHKIVRYHQVQQSKKMTSKKMTKVFSKKSVCRSSIRFFYLVVFTYTVGSIKSVLPEFKWVLSQERSRLDAGWAVQDDRTPVKKLFAKSGCSCRQSPDSVIFLSTLL